MKELLKLKKKIAESRNKYIKNLENEGEDILNETRVDALQDVLNMINTQIDTSIRQKLVDLREVDWKYSFPDLILEDILNVYDLVGGQTNIFESYKELRGDLTMFISKMDEVYQFEEGEK